MCINKTNQFYSIHTYIFKQIDQHSTCTSSLLVGNIQCVCLVSQSAHFASVRVRTVVSHIGFFLARRARFLTYIYFQTNRSTQYMYLFAPRRKYTVRMFSQSVSSLCKRSRSHSRQSSWFFFSPARSFPDTKFSTRDNNNEAFSLVPLF